MIYGCPVDALAAEFVVVGGGSSGCAVAGRLAEAGRDVLLLEAGPDYGSYDNGNWPAELLSARMLAITHDWGYGTDRWTFERAKVMGGCSSHNGAIAAVGHRSDYDNWNLAGWSGAEVAPLFSGVIERMRVRTYEDWEAGPFHRCCLLAATELGWPIASDLCDLDAGASFGLETVNVVDGVRWNTSFAYVDPVRDRLRILDRVMVDRIDHSSGGSSVIGERNGEQLVIDAGTVVLTAGVYGTPGILERSGVGDPAVLRAAGIEVRHGLPGVGANLHDHPLVEADRVVGPELQAWLDEASATGFLPEEQTLGKFVSSASADGLYDMHVYPVCASDQTSVIHGRVVVVVSCVTPLSRGAVHVTSADPRTAPIIDHRYLSDENGHDLAVLRDGLVTAQQLLNHPQVATILGDAITDVSNDEGIRQTVKHYYHPVGSCAMGSGSMAVCDANGRVHGMSGVVVADVSLMPQIPRANTNMPAVMIGERIARTLI